MTRLNQKIVMIAVIAMSFLFVSNVVNAQEPNLEINSFSDSRIEKSIQKEIVEMSFIGFDNPEELKKLSLNMTIEFNKIDERSYLNFMVTLVSDFGTIKANELDLLRYQKNGNFYCLEDYEGDYTPGEYDVEIKLNPLEGMKGRMIILINKEKVGQKVIDFNDFKSTTSQWGLFIATTTTTPEVKSFHLSTGFDHYIDKKGEIK